MLIDSWGRQITYLRISVTDRCNMRCVYCTPPEGIRWKAREEILSYEEISSVVSVAARLGIRFIRLTGGEPLVRPDLPVLISALAAIPGIEEVSLTTNGSLLEKFAKPLAEAGLKRVNISLDTLDAERFRFITRGGDIEQVWRGIATAEMVGLNPIKVNTVIVRGLNSDEIVPLAQLTRRHPWHIRFIELMPIGNGGDWGSEMPVPYDRYFSVAEMKELLTDFDLQPIHNSLGNGPERTYRIPGSQGTIGFISPVSEHFCSTCNRLRLTADGCLRSCLMSDQEVPVRAAIHKSNTLEILIRQAIAMKPESHHMSEALCLAQPAGGPISTRYMTQIGG
ncbi:MAG TPA: GTP 3',8-cyclase MoaA [Anaerolineales bacterium]|nr:GTP 3',8-cyclase MoaA [Anaerolineales bacterium]